MSRNDGMALPERWRLSNRLTVLYRQDTSAPLAAASLILPRGSAEEPRAKAGIASFTMALLTQGTRRLKAEAYARIVEALGASLGTDATEDYADLAFGTPAEHFGTVLGLAAEALRFPRFAPTEILKEKAQTLASLRSRHDTLFNLSYDAFNEALYGKSHPYGRVGEGRPETVAAISKADCRAWQSHALRPQGVVLSLVAPQSSRVARGLIERYFGEWERPGRARAEPPSPVGQLPVPLRASKSVRLAAKFEQAYLMTGCLAPEAHHPAFLAIKLFNMVIGGGMSSRLFMELREKRGLAYEVASFFPTRLQTSQWVAYLGTPPEKLKEAKRALNALLDRAQKGVTAPELEQAKRMLNAAFWTEHQTRRRQAWYAAWWEFLGRDPDYDQTYLKKINAVSLAQVRAAGRELLSQPRVTVEVSPR